MSPGSGDNEETPGLSHLAPGLHDHSAVMERLLLPLLLLPVLVGALPARAAPRCATIIQETIDGQPSSIPFAEAAIAEALIAAGLEPVDETQARKIRSAFDPRDWADGEGKLTSTITPRDADVIISLVSRITRVESAMLGKNLQRLDALFSAKVIAVDSGRIITALSSAGEGLGHSQAEAATHATKAAATRFAKTLEKTLRERAQAIDVELVVSGLKDASSVRELRDGLAVLPGIKSVELLASDPGGAKLSVRVVAISAETLATTIEATPALSLFVYAISPRTLRAERRSPTRDKIVKTSADRPLMIRSLVFHPARPAELLAFPERPIGKLVLANEGTRPIEATLIVHGPELLGASAALPRARIGAKKEIELPVRLPLDPARLRASRDRRSVPLRVEVEYRLGEELLREEINAPLVLSSKNSISWSDPESVASFVTARAEPILEYARTLRDAIPPSELDDPRALPAALFAGIKSSSIAYAPDPSGAIGSEADYVQFPLETLARRRGDCDDLAVLLSALSEAVGVRALLLLGPDHVLVAFNTGLPPQATRSADAFFRYEDTLYLPLETTMLDKTFSEAWTSAAATLDRWQATPDALKVVDVERAWARQPPIDLSTEAQHRAPNPAAIRARVTAELAAMAAGERRELETRLGRLKSNAERALVLVELERVDEARDALEKHIAESSSPSSLNDLANVYVLQGELAKADQTYQRALRGAERSQTAQIRANLALVALERGDEKRFAKHIVACLEAGGDALVRALARAGVTQETKGRVDAPLSLSRLLFWLSGARRI
jgi:transglutaminase-like putative cysteine protease